MSRLRVLFHVQHLLGIGHLQRAAAIAAAMQAAGLEVTVASGGEPVAGLALGGAALVQLPPAVAADSSFSQILDAAGRPIDEAWQAARRSQLLDLFARLAPDLVLIELFPFGRRFLRFELLPLLEAAAVRGPRPAVAVSVRDILVAGEGARAAAKAEEAADLVLRHVDRVLVHGDPRLVAFDATFPAARRIAGRIAYTGYVIGRPPPAAAEASDGGGEVLVSTGGGLVGLPLLLAALAARPLTRLADARWRLITGPNLPAEAAAEIAARAAAADEPIIVERFRPDFRALLARCRLSLSQAGYNTVMETLSAGARAVVAPFAEGKESEQTLRAKLLAARGWLTLAPDLAPAALAAAIDAALDRPRPAVAAIDLDGAAKTAQLAAALAEAARAGRLPARGR
jgi:predicted glycosyltransferase